ncbi:efflux RND transporter periplasmic adaptor subunit [Roseomonas sp. OT10]|uniref:efflux RND transporter periplasmic adaptor subunit n=1 Tax=Roseomonas cutis TaxID=2897332 RepID=UPI001E4855A8|nr:efflux RND transporter periplasmic adaptor subunit [Roseomonas sp. OT10]UFN49952.1 efflux RND transporter periplasmic adaptor subunit [Roseomonas sp. OT10]
MDAGHKPSTLPAPPWRRLALSAAVLLAAGLPAPHAALAQGQAAPPAALTVAAAPVEIRAVERSVRGDGSIVAWQELVLGAEVAGLRVVELGAEEGDRVRQGQLLVRLDDAVLRAQAAQAAAAVTEAEANLRLAQAELRRVQELQRGEYAARQTLEQRQANAAGAEARLAAARAQRDDAEARLAQTRILAPTDGIVTTRRAQLGTVVSLGQEMLRLIRDGRIELDARVPELDLAAIAPGQAARVRHGGREVTATVRAIAPTVAPETRLGIVHLSLPPDSGLRPGMFASAAIVTGRADSPTIPREALLHRDGRPVAFAVEGDRVALRRLELGMADLDGRVEVRAGLSPGERVVVAGAGFLNDGDRVRLAEPAARAEARR